MGLSRHVQVRRWGLLLGLLLRRAGAGLPNRRPGAQEVLSERRRCRFDEVCPLAGVLVLLRGDGPRFVRRRLAPDDAPAPHEPLPVRWLCRVQQRGRQPRPVLEHDARPLDLEVQVRRQVQDCVEYAHLHARLEAARERRRIQDVRLDREGRPRRGLLPMALAGAPREPAGNPERGLPEQLQVRAAWAHRGLQQKRSGRLGRRPRGVRRVL
mmetsp:Transcript_60923/g.175536  ORF Transcript_60923/g.175536 Transcript_60923/m.175536 type:complete len:211 (-) Transcript_60923:1140-1772(-)